MPEVNTQVTFTEEEIKQLMHEKARKMVNDTGLSSKIEIEFDTQKGAVEGSVVFTGSKHVAKSL